MIYRTTVVILLALVAAGCGKHTPVQARQETGPAKVRAAKVQSREIYRTVDTVGTLYSFDEAVISAEVEGRVERIDVDLGDAVRKDQVLVKISDEEQKYLVAQNEAQLRQSLERLGLKSENEKVKDIRETPDVRRARADLFDAEQRHKRTSELVDQGIGSRSDLDQTTARLQAATATYDATLNQTRNLIQEVERFKALLELQRKKLRDTVVTAPFAGAVKERQVAPGQYVRANSPLVTLVKVDPVRLRIEVPERFAPWIKSGQVAEVSVEAFEGRKFQGKIWRISPTVDQSKRTFVVEALIDNPAGELKPGSYARARVPTYKVERILLMPMSALNYVLGSNKAYVIKEGEVEARDVKLGDRFAENVEIVEGLEDGLLVATSQLTRLDTGAKVQVIEGEEPRPKAE